MNYGTVKTPNAPPRSPGFTLVEAAISIMLVGVLLVAALNTVGSAKIGQQNTTDRGRAVLLAQELMSEIMRQEYADPEDVGTIDLTDGSLITSSLGRDSGESGGDRADHDDVDDYDGWAANPPENKDGTTIANLTNWERSVKVERLNLTDLSQLSSTESGLKRITVSVTYKAVPLAQLIGLRGAGLPPLPAGPTVMFVVEDTAALTAQELARQTLMESWGCSVSLIATTASQVDLDTAAALADVAYVSEQVDHTVLNDKLAATTIGVVNEESKLISKFYFSSSYAAATFVSLDIVNNTHYITSVFAPAPTQLCSSTQNSSYSSGALATDLQVLGQFEAGKPSLMTLEKGATGAGGNIIAGRRVQLPWGDTGFDFNALNADGRTIMKRAIEWAAGMEKP